jgi:beta-xylosidase
MQLALADTPDGRWFWMGQFNRVDSDGRTPNLLPVTWVDDWPVVGAHPSGRQGSMAWQLPKPVLGQPISVPQGSDSFDVPKLSPQWIWNHQPRDGMWSLTERPGYLRLHAFRPARPGFFGAADTLNQRHPRSNASVVTIKIDVSGFANGQEGGLAHFNGGSSFATFSVVQRDGKRLLKYEEKNAQKIDDLLPPGTNVLWLRSTVTIDEQNHYSFSVDGVHFTPFGGAYPLTAAGYRGDMAGIYTFNPLKDDGYLDVDSFESTVENHPEP